MKTPPRSLSDNPFVSNSLYWCTPGFLQSVVPVFAYTSSLFFLNWSYVQFAGRIAL